MRWARPWTVWHRFLDNPRSASDGHDRQAGSYLGPVYSNDEIVAFLDARGYPYRRVDENERADAIAQCIAEGQIVGHPLRPHGVRPQGPGGEKHSR